MKLTKIEENINDFPQLTDNVPILNLFVLKELFILLENIT